MTHSYYQEIRANYSTLSASEFLGTFIRTVLSNLNLTGIETAQVAAITSVGSYLPAEDELFKLCLEVLLMGTNRDINGLIRLLKLLKPTQAEGIQFLFNGVPNKQAFFDADQQKGTREVKGLPKSKSFKDMTWDEYKRACPFGFDANGLLNNVSISERLDQELIRVYGADYLQKDTTELESILKRYVSSAKVAQQFYDMIVEDNPNRA